ncbi:MAG: SDR family NAD(P)-dependent oxidoreductase [Methanobacteriota archaeon]|nr:MAG: SDR family NAD(P)-dependent oxidoreductase [Euryarchaeota archaeon]
MIMNGSNHKKIRFEAVELHEYEPVAIVGLGAVMPDALNIDEFWRNIYEGRNSIGEVPKDRWDPDLFYDPDPSVPDKTYTKIGAFIKNFKFDGLKFRIPPKMANKLDPIQQMALTAAKEALEDANYESENFNRENTAVIIGNSMGGEIVRQYTRRVYFPEIVESLKQTKAFKNLSPSDQQQLIVEVEQKYKSHLEEITEDSMPGELANVIAGRIANVFNLRGKNMTTDAACASSMAAIDEAFKSLVTHEVDAVVCGGADRSMDVSTYVKFCKIGALSPDGSFPFDARANGFVMGEGVGFFVLKRLSDAIRDGNKIYALIRGVGASSDGKGKGITAPNPLGQQLAIERAYKIAGISPAEVSLIEAHGTSTKVGDVVEVETLHKVFNKYKIPKGSIALGSIKSQIGHLKSAAGAAAIIKTALALHHKILPPSINFETPNPKIDWANSPFYVNTKAKEWKHEPGKTRKAGVSSFGFGGTNFHIVMEEYDPSVDYFANKKKRERVFSRSYKTFDYDEYVRRNKNLQGEPFAISGKTKDEFRSNVNLFFNSLPEGTNLESPELPSLIQIRENAPFSPQDKFRVAIAATFLEILKDKRELVEKGLKSSQMMNALMKRGVFFSKAIPKGKLAFVFPGQGSQYVNMVKDLYDKYTVVKKTVDEADQILHEFLGKKISSIMFGNPKKQEKVLKQTQYTQPAILVADIAIFRLLEEFGISPDMVAGHSLGEYAALVAAGVLSFKDALMAVAVRGRAMANVKSEDKGTMASVSAPLETIQEVLKTVDDYVIPANLNSKKQIVISGSTKGVEKAIEALTKKGIKCIPLSVSAAFHTEIVAPAAVELAEFLKTIKFNKPKIKVSSNVLGDFYPEDPEEIRNLLEKQVESPVHWIHQCETMYDEGARIFLEVGPKRALASFVTENLDGKDVIAQITNHPKNGGIYHLAEALALFMAMGMDLDLPSDSDDRLVDEAKWHPPEPSPADVPKIQETKISPPPHDSKAFEHYISSQPDLRKLMQEEMFQTFLKSQGAVFNQFLQSSYESFKKLYHETNAIAEKVQKMGLNLDDVVITGAGVGLPGKFKEIFDQRNIELILDGYNFIDPVDERKLQQQTDKNIVKLVKRDKGQPTLEKINNIRDVIKLAAQGGKFDLVEEYQLADKIIEAYDRTTQLAIAAGLEALKDAGIPLVRTYVRTTTGSYLPGDWALPEELREDTGIIFASAFPGYDSLVKDLSEFYQSKFAGEALDVLRKVYGEIIRKLGDKEDYRDFISFLEENLDELEKHRSVYQFNRKFLFKILSMGHSQFAQLIKAYGPNTQTNAACASTTQAVGIAQDWIRAGRCKRVIIIGADDASGDQLFEWIGSGFLASGAATTKAKVSEAALPFDRRRHGMIIGMGAVGLVVETESEAKRRGIKPIVKILGTYYSNSAYHGTRLDVNHISRELEYFFKKVTAQTGLTVDEIAKSAMFMSHETYTPARGGSAAAEIQSLRHVFGQKASQIIIANTKGFTGHPMGAGIEDAIAIKALQYGKIPPIANFKEPDENLGDLTLSKGGKYNVKYAIRLAAGFGSQLAFALYEKAAGLERKTPRYNEWLKSIGGSQEDLTFVGKTLRLKDRGPPKGMPQSKSTRQVPKVTKQKVSRPKPTIPARRIDNVLDWISKETGYPVELLDDYVNPVRDLGIDPSRFREVLGAIDKKIDELTIGDVKGIRPTISSSTQPPTKPLPMASAMAPKKPKTDDSLIDKIKAIISEKTGYPPEMLDPDLDMEADLGIDTVKQAELFGLIRESFGIPLIEDLDLSEYNTIAKIAEFVSTYSSPSVQTKAKEKVAQSSSNRNQILSEIKSIISEKTGYPPEMLDPDLDMEADLGIDTVKQAELIGVIREHYGIPMIEDLDLSEYNTISRIVDFVMEHSGSSVSPQASQIERQKETTTVSDTDDILDEVIEIISEKTGYPPEMLEPDLDMEADLGIDTVKQAELFGVIRENYGIPMIEDLDLSEYNTIRKVVNFVNEHRPQTETKSKTKPTVVSKAIASNDRSEILAKIISIISEKTGYPPDMLDPDLDMEADLGIDTVKQAELIGAIREYYGIPLIDDLDISEYNTINRVVDFVLTYRPSEKTTVIQTQENGNQVASLLKKRVSELTGFPEDLIDENIDLEKEMGIDKSQIIQIVDQVVKELKLPDNKVTSQTIASIANELLAKQTTPEKQKHATHRYVIKLIQKPREGKPRKRENVIVYGNHRLPNVRTIKDLNELSNEKLEQLVIVNPPSTMDMVALFELFKNNIETLKFVAISEVNPKAQTLNDLSPVAGAIGGMIKALHKEFGISGKIVLAQDHALLENELFTENQDMEVVLMKDQRLIPALMEEDLPEAKDGLPSGSILIASGGAQGITYQCVKALVERSENVHAILIGRTKIRDNASNVAKMDVNQLEKLKHKLLEQLKENNQRVTPVMLNKEFEKITKSAQVYKSIEELKSLGAKVTYVQEDITNEGIIPQISKILENEKTPVYVIHGAGVEISRATKSKSTDEFRLIYDIKVKGLENLVAATKNRNVARFVAFSSVAGRFGNATQIDYSAANEYLAKSVQKLRKQKVNAIAIDWSAWDEIGMATRGSTMKVLEAAGVTPIPLKEGVRRFLSEFFYSSENEVIISGELGQLASGTIFTDKEDAKPKEGSKLDDSTKPTVELQSPPKQTITSKKEKPSTDDFPTLNPNYPMIHETTEVGKILSGKRIINLSQDLYLEDHRIDGKAVLPGVMGLEFFTEFVNFHEGQVIGMRAVQFSSPVKLPKDKPLELYVVPERVTGMNSVKLTLKSKFIGPDGKQLGDLRNHFSAEIIEGDLLPGYPFIPSTQAKWFTTKKSAMSRKEIYDLFFHGPSFQVLKRIISVGAHSVSAEFRLPSEPLFSDPNAKTHFVPLLIEACFQTAGMFDLLINRTMSLPYGITKIQMYQGVENAKYIHATQTRQKDNLSHYNVVALDKDLNVVLELINYEMIHTGTVQSVETPKLSPEPTIVPVIHALGKITPLAITISTDAMENLKGDFLDTYLNPSEKVIYARLNVPKRKLEWIAGTIAAKKAISLTFNIPENEVEIIKNKNGKPGGIFNGMEYPVTKTHSNGVASAMAHPDGGVGLDIERIEPRDPSLIETAFTEDEIKRFKLTPEKHKLITQLWSIKEAALKAIGTGLKTSLKDTIVRKLEGEHKFSVKVKRKTISITSFTTDEWVISLALVNS